MDVVIFILAMGGLIFGADFIVNQSERIALRFNISEYIIGATLIALGTSLPEMSASIAASLEGKPEIAIANAVGSNIMNITLVLAVIFIITKRFVTERDFFAKDSIWALMAILMFLLMAMDGVINTFDASLLIILMIAYLLFLIQDSKGLGRDNLEEDTEESFSWFKSIALLSIGFIFIIIGAHFAIDSASSIAKSFGVSEWTIGVILISFGTSLPELVISISAVLKGKVEMAIGNIIGSNIANTTIVIGMAALAGDLPINLEKYAFDLALMTVANIMLIYITANKLYNRAVGIALLLLLALFIENALSGIKVIGVVE
ncbi:Inner membrane protein YrbG, predicted calcium/sodium:proton antiporter [hydrothermal vent metagenome]|uniref:Inner membrane protein YrbG, predicted calcium/sodium:proton antiporter n=1 Tax=hydrothermal vent metagenome TaxID=652676 RepID=A0A1W1CME2_9ZZZZ